MDGKASLPKRGISSLHGGEPNAKGLSSQDGWISSCDGLWEVLPGEQWLTSPLRWSTISAEGLDAFLEQQEPMASL